MAYASPVLLLKCPVPGCSFQTVLSFNFSRQCNYKGLCGNKVDICAPGQQATHLGGRTHRCAQAEAQPAQPAQPAPEAHPPAEEYVVGACVASVPVGQDLTDHMQNLRTTQAEKHKSSRHSHSTHSTLAEEVADDGVDSGSKEDSGSKDGNLDVEFSHEESRCATIAKYVVEEKLTDVSTTNLLKMLCSFGLDVSAMTSICNAWKKSG